MNKYYIVDAEILPDVLDKVIEARGMLESGMIKQVSEAVKEWAFPEELTINIKTMYFLPCREEKKEKQ